jgi:hypothetical protein
MSRPYDTSDDGCDVCRFEILGDSARAMLLSGSKQRQQAHRVVNSSPSRHWWSAFAMVKLKQAITPNPELLRMRSNDDATVFNAEVCRK